MRRATKFMVHSAIALAFIAFLLPVKASAIFPGDTNFDGIVSIAEVQTVINAFLGLLPNAPPLADAGPARNVEVGIVVTLDGSQSSDPDGYPVTYSWTLASKPAGSSAALADATAAKPAFTPDLEGEYTFNLIVNDGTLNSAVAHVMVTAVPHSSGYTAALTFAATAITNSSAQLNGSFTNPGGYTTSVWFEYGTTTAYGSSTSHDAYAAVGLIPITASISALSPLTTFHFRLVTQNSAGFFYGEDKTFTTFATPEVLAADLDAPQGFVANGDYAYWFEIYGGRLRRVNLTTGAVNTLATVVTFGNSGGIAIDANHVYFSASGAIMRADLDGSNLNQNFSPTANTQLIVPHSTGLYVRHNQDILAGGVWTNHQYISRISLDGSERTLLYERTPLGSEGFSGDMVVDDTHIYWSDYFKGTIQKMPLSGGPPVTIALGIYHPTDLLLDGATLYLLADDGNSLKSLPTGGGVVTNIATISGSRAMTKVGNSFYLAGNGLNRFDLSSGVTTPLVEGADIYYPAVVSSTYIYWITSGSHFESYLGKLWRLPKL